jgi:F-type H+-transporting ATPase subunit delta
MAKLISKTYGEALYEVATETGREEEFLNELNEVVKVMEDNADFGRLILHPSIPKQEKLRFTGEVFRGRLSDEMVGFLLTLVEKERFSSLKAIAEYYTQRYKEAKGIGVAYVTTPSPLGDAGRASVEAKLLETTDYKQMEMHYETDPDLIGGIIIRIGDRVADGSVRNKLNELKQELLQVQLG